MLVLVSGLVLFLGVHSVRIVADGWRAARIAAMGEGAWKSAFSLVSAVGLVLIVWGYGLSRHAPVELWSAPTWSRHLASLLTLVAFVLIVAAYVRHSRLRAIVGHPMLAGVKLWALAHLLSNGTAADLLLFGSFLVWAILAFRAARRRDRAEGIVRSGSWSKDLVPVVVGTAGWFVFALYLHGPLIGVRPFA